jgi:ATP-dependent DNA helicase RecQ
MMLKDDHGKNDEERRKLYVGMTRAKNNLFIHANTDLFTKYVLPDVVHVVDSNDYNEPSEIVLQTTHRDVVLDYFKRKKELIFDLRSGTALKIDDVYLSAELHGRDVHVAKFSKAFVEMLEKLKAKGYSPTSSEVRFIVAWKGEEDNQETPILLTEIHFQK